MAAKKKKLTGAALRVAAAREVERAQNGGNPSKKKAAKKKASRKKRPARKKTSRKRGALDLGELDHAAQIIDRARKLIEKADGKKTPRRRR